MLGTPRLVLFLTAALLAPYSYTLSTQALAQSSDNNTKLSSIKGRVLADGQAVTDGTVTVSSVNSSRQSRTVPTNDNGDFEFKGLEPGMYRVEVSAPGVASPCPGAGYSFARCP